MSKLFVGIFACASALMLRAGTVADATPVFERCSRVAQLVTVSDPITLPRYTGTAFGPLIATTSAYGPTRTIAVRFPYGATAEEALNAMDCRMMRPADKLDLHALRRTFETYGVRPEHAFIALGARSGDRVTILVPENGTLSYMDVPATGRWGQDAVFLAILDPVT